ncbi:MAG TPA: AmmeMemoRadiSam system protein B [Bryobacteraceae bacterium]|nr:AmmeMemoRadiSam system protein B [Bryobacteraceae bacterium]
MAQPLPRLRMNLDFMPSPLEDRPGLLIRDSYGYSESTLIIPPPLVSCLECFDGEQTELELRAELVRITGELDVSRIESHLIETLERAGFLENETYERMREARHRAFAEQASREPAHAGTGYPDDLEEARQTLSEYMAGSMPPPERLAVAIAAPHVSPFGGYESYRDAYGALRNDRDATYIILGTSHYGPPDRFGLTRKNYLTPFGQARTNEALLKELEKQPAAIMEDYSHAIEHSIEFQVLFLQHLFGPDVSVLPVLCGAFASSLYNAGKPEDDEDVRRFFDALGEIGAREKNVRWVLGIDMAHMGARYGDRFAAISNAGEMLTVADRDKARIDSVVKGDADGFWDQVQENSDDLKWCGSAPLYTFLRAQPGLRGELRRYQQWNIDSQSVVSFAAMSFSKC